MCRGRTGRTHGGLPHGFALIPQLPLPYGRGSAGISICPLHFYVAHDRLARGDGFQEDNAEALLNAREAEDVGTIVFPGQGRKRQIYSGPLPAMRISSSGIVSFKHAAARSRTSGRFDPRFGRGNSKLFLGPGRPASFLHSHRHLQLSATKQLNLSGGWSQTRPGARQLTAVGHTTIYRR